jgi:antitoxin HicB
VKHEYAVVLETAEEGGFVVRVPAIPEAHTQGETVEEALQNAREVIMLCLDVRRDRGQEIPPSDADARLAIVAVDDAA